MVKIKEDYVNLNEPAPNDEISADFEKIHVIYPEMSANRQRKNLKHNKVLRDFMRKYC